MDPRSRLIGLGLLLFSHAAHVAAQANDVPARVLEFCRANVGKRVGDGECSSLADHALAAAGAARSGRDSPGAGDYVWGRQVAVIESDLRGAKGVAGLKQTRPGDIVQFRNVRLEGAARDGRRGRYWMATDHHTAVVADVDPALGMLTIFHQNWGAKKVGRTTLHLADLVKGWMRIYRPLPGRG